MYIKEIILLLTWPILIFISYLIIKYIFGKVEITE